MPTTDTDRPRKRGRPPKHPPPDAPEPAPEGKNLTTEQFFERAASYPDPRATCIYVYRLWPRIVRPPRQAYIEKSTELTLEQLRYRHGSGVYQVRFTDSNKKPPEQFRAKVKIDEPDVPPALDLAELDLGHPDNQGYIAWLKARGLLHTEDQSAMAETSAVKEVTEFARDVLRQHDKKTAAGDASAVVEAVRVLDQVQARQQGQPLALLKALRDVLPAGGGNDAVVAKLLEQNNALMSRLIDARAPEQQNPLGQVEQVLELMGKLRRAGGGAPSADSGGFDWSKLPGLIQSGLQAFLQMRAAAPGAMPAAPAAIPAPLPPAAPGAAEHAPAAVAAAPTQEETMFAAMLGLSVPQLRALMQLAPAALDAFQAGVSGRDFADGYVPPKLYAGLESCGRDGMLQLLGMVPQGAALLESRRAEVEAWIDSFLSYGSEDETEIEGQS